jgi:hypothetical protein
MVMELLHGRTLRDAIREYRQLNVAEVLSIGAQIADGVQAAHEQNAIHRDLNPKNVFVLEENAVKVLDFGIAKFLGAGAEATQKDLFNGTILYMSPEHLQGSRVSPRSDIYALGTTLYEALAGRPPCLIGMPEPTLESVIFAQIQRMPTPLDVLTATVPRFVARAIQRMLAKEPADRFATMAEVSNVLRAHLQRFVSEFSDSAASQRVLWRGTQSISPASGAVRSSQAATDVHELGPATSSNVAMRPSLAAGSATPLPFPPDPTVRAALPLQTPRLPSAPVRYGTPVPYSAPVPYGAPARLQPPVLGPRLEAEPALTHTKPTLVLASITLPQLLLSAVALGTLVGLAIGLIQGLPRSQPAATTSGESAARSVPSSARPESAASHPPVATSALHPPIATVRSPDAGKLAPKAIKAGRASGLDADTGLRKKAKIAAPVSSSSARPVRRKRAIYGSDDDDAVTR